MSGVIRWEEPPPNKSGGRKKKRPDGFWTAVAEQLRDRPGEWAVALEGEDYLRVGGLTSAIAQGRVAPFRPGGTFEAKTRSTSAGFTLYIRYVGGES